MKYSSTRGGDNGLSFEDAVFSSYAADGGMYVPDEIPTLTKDVLKKWATLTFPELCAEVVALYSDIPIEDCRKMTTKAFSTFNGGNNPPLPLKKFDKTYFLETGEGPTLAFKDVGQQVLAQILQWYLSNRRGYTATVLVDTSGDTGPAAIAAVQQCPNIRIFVLYPNGRVSPVQELQMITVDAPNVFVYRTEGTSDEQAEVLKEVFLDEQWTKKNNVISMNSINWGRIACQSAYYIWVCLQASPNMEKDVNFVVPTGAFGNACAGYVAKIMGANIGQIVCATNTNDVTHKFFTEGVLVQGETHQTISPAMDIQFAYNLERLIYLTSGRQASKIKDYMNTLEKERSVKLDDDILDKIRKTFTMSCAVSDKEIMSAMTHTWNTHKYLLCPHSACAVQARLTIAKEIPEPCVCVLTANPAKFESTVKEATGENVTHPIVEELKQKNKDHFTWLKKESENWRENWKTIVKAAVEKDGEKE
eukprot:m.84378 g.84378  ORF g.84378 m.84378 type:complete len:476 (-) comp12963_c0_seq4:128-1555(-)